MAVAGSDPTGGAGIQADIEAIASMGCHAAPVITAVTVQDTTNVMAFTPQTDELVMEQARAVLEDMPVAAIKIGFLGSVEIIETLHVLLRDYPDIPVVLDPVFTAGGGAVLADEDMINALRALLLPQCTMLTPNTQEARVLAPGADSQDACAMAILERGVEYVLITGTHDNTPQVVNQLYGSARKLDSFSWQRLPGEFHGSGCTLSAALCGLLAQGQEPVAAANEAQEYTWQTLRHGYRLGMGQRLPNRLFWASTTP
jgi:hydroxymethylpyrimidine/phosphomethylpyrimidine kinase